MTASTPLPMDSGPMAWFYNKDVFDKAGVDPTQVRTWDDFYRGCQEDSRRGLPTSPPIPVTPASSTHDLAGPARPRSRPPRTARP